jgi:4-amino-4-deoxy-L-arabinose transferase-like glycosyltransferase
MAIALLVSVRCLSLLLYPVLDTTEARYAEIARKMVETGNWLTPQIAYGVPFWGKPPLSTWLSAASMTVFGVNEWAARLPSLLLMIGCGALVFWLGRVRAGRDAGLLASALFATTALVFIAGGAVMTDESLALGTTLAMAGFWIAVEGAATARRTAGFTFFVGMAIGLLAKGPVALVLTFIPIGGWTLWTKSWRAVWNRLPWIWGPLLASALVLPWYLAAERATPGFLNYFIIGEHFKRFVVTGWKGDLYGTAHASPRGLIWALWIAAALPWSLLAIGWIVRAERTKRDALVTLFNDRWQRYLLLWTVAPMLCFMLSGNIVVTYVLPGLPAFALLLLTQWRADETDARDFRAPSRHVIVAAVVLSIGFVGVTFAMRQQFETVFSNRALVQAYETKRSSAAERLVYIEKLPYSAAFYTRGKVVLVADSTALAPLIDDTTVDYFAMRKRDFAVLRPAERLRLAEIGTFGTYRLMQKDIR